MQNNSGIKAFVAGAGGVSAHTLVKMDTGTVVPNTATATDEPIGVALYDAAEDELVAVHLINLGGSVEITAAGAITAGAVVYAAADGEVQALPEASADYRRIGIALEAAGADGDIIEILPCGHTDIETVSGT